MGDGDFHEFRRLYDHRFTEHEGRLDRVEAVQSRQATDLTVLKVKAGLWGAASGAIVTAAFVIAKAAGL